MDFDLVYDAASHYRSFSRAVFMGSIVIIPILAFFCFKTLKNRDSAITQKVSQTLMLVICANASLILFSHSTKTASQIEQAIQRNDFRTLKGVYHGTTSDGTYRLLVADRKIDYKIDGIVTRRTFSSKCRLNECAIQKGDYVQVSYNHENIFRIHNSKRP